MTKGLSPRQVAARGIRCAVAAAVCAGAVAGLQAQTLTDAQNLFYNARYKEAADLALAIRSLDADELANTELRTSALLFQLRRLLEGQPGSPATGDMLAKCAVCPPLIVGFLEDFHRGQSLARITLEMDPGNEAALFFLGKLNLNYVWLQLGPLKKKTGWDEYWEARRSLDAVLKMNPRYVRARVARAWVDYIVATRMPWGSRWVLGGGNKKRALTAVREAAATEADFYTHAEAEFALWDMQVRDRATEEAVEVARRLAQAFPENPELATFLRAPEASSRP